MKKNTKTNNDPHNVGHMGVISDSPEE